MATMAVNRIAEILGGRLRPQLKSTPFDMGDAEVGTLERYVEKLVLQSRTLKERESKISAREQALARREDEASQRAIKIATSLTGAMLVIAEFAYKNKQKLSDVYFGMADNEFRFIFVTTGAQYDWDFRDELTDIETVLVKDYDAIPVSCLTIPLNTTADSGAVLQNKVCKLIWASQDAGNK